MQLQYTLLSGILILISGLIIGKTTKNILIKFMKQSELHKKIKVSDETIIPSLVAYSLYIITLILVGSTLGISIKRVETTVSIVILIVATLIIITYRDVFPNLAIRIFKNKHIQKEGKMSYENIEGEIKSVRLTETMIQTKKNDIIGIPHSLLIKKES